ncbi:DegT/DnrJ/EryC1/StrS family aminotransferase [Candidatus Mycalebacterium sp.]
MKKVPFLDLAAQHSPIADEIKRGLGNVVDSGAFVLGSEVENFEREFAKYTDTRHAVCVNSGTSALHLALLAAGVGRGDEVIVPAMTFIATAMAATYIGAKPVCVDVDRFCTMDSNALEDAITPKTKAIMPVHLYGQPADMSPITGIAEKHGIAVIEDAAQAHGAADKGRKCGSVGRAAAWSFYPGKNLGALGEGGAVTTDDDEIAEKCRILRDWGQSGKGNHIEKGFNYRMDAFQGAVLGVKLGHIEKWTHLRISAADYYREKLAGVSGIETLPIRENARCVWHIFPVMVENRDKVAKNLRDAGIGVSVHYPRAVHLHPCYKDLGYKKGDFPNAEKIAEKEISLPMFPGITREQIDMVVNALCAAVE